MKTNKTNNTISPKRKYWYRDEVDVCVLCGKETHYRERVYIETDKGTHWKDNACYGHF